MRTDWFLKRAYSGFSLQSTVAFHSNTVLAHYQMSASLLFLLLTVVFIVAGLVLYALSRNRDVKAFCKLPFAVFSFEAKQPGTTNPNVGKNDLS